MIDSTNPRQLADNIRKLWDKFKSISGDLLPSRSTATTGQILKLTGETKTPAWADEYSYTPPAYSETEVNTGQKWINGKDIFSCVFSGDIAEQSSAFTLVYFNDLDINPLYTLGYIANSDETLYTFISRLDTAYVRSTGRLYSASIPVTYSQGKYSVIIYYTKPDPTPGRAPEDPEQEPEPEEKKTTKKKTTTK